MPLEGKIFEYNEYGSIAYRSGISINSKINKAIILIGGLEDNILSIKYTERLEKYCKNNSITLVIPQLRSQPNFEMHSIEDDLDDIENLIKTTDGEIVLIGHSTGCQDILLYLERLCSRLGDRRENFFVATDSSIKRIRAIILQAPVSDIEANIDLQYHVQEAKSMLSDTFYMFGDRVWRRERFISLYERHGKEDLFSGYLDDEDFAKWKNINFSICCILSGKDEYATLTPNLIHKFSLMGKLSVIKDGDHGLTEEPFQEEFIKVIDEFLKEVGFN